MRHDNALVEIEASYIKWKQFGVSREILNGLALCMIRHKAFDNINIGLNEFMQVLVPEAAKGSRTVG